MSVTQELDSSKILSDSNGFLLTGKTLVINGEVFAFDKITGFGHGLVATEDSRGCIGTIIALVFQQSLTKVVGKPALFIYLDSGDSRAIRSKPEKIVQTLANIYDYLESDNKENKIIKFDIANATIGQVGDGVVSQTIRGS